MGLFDDVLTPQPPAKKKGGLFDDVLAEAPPPERSAQDYIFDLATRVRQGTRNVVGGLVGLPVDIANLATEAPRLALRGGNALREAVGLDALPVNIPALQQPDFVQGIRESGNINNAIDAAEHLSPKAAQQAQEFQSMDGLLASLGYLAKNPSYAGTEIAAQIPQFLQIAPGSTLGTIALQGASAASQNNQQIGDTMRAEGASEQAIADTLADAYAPSLIGNTLLPAVIPGGAAIERVLAGNAGKELLAAGGSRARRALVDFLGETGTEGAQEGIDQIVQNLATGHPWDEQVGQNVALGAAIGAPGGLAAGTYEGVTAQERPGAEPAPPTNAIDPALLARGNAELQAANEPAPATIADVVPPQAAPVVGQAETPAAAGSIDELVQRNLPEIIQTIQNNPDVPWAEAAKVLGLESAPEAQPPSRLPPAEPKGQNPQEIAARMRVEAQQRAAQEPARVPQQTTAPAVQPSVPAPGSGRAGGDLAPAAKPEALPTPEQLRPQQPTVDATMQNRDRSRAASVSQMQDIRRNPDADRLGFSRDPNTGAPMVGEGRAIPDSDKGREDTVIMASGRRVPVQYAVVEADDLTASHNADGQVNPDYAGAPLKALNNGRTAGLQAAYASGNAESYRQGIAADAGLHGVSAAAIASKRQPVLVRLYDPSANNGDMGAESNASAQLGLSPVEQAQTDARSLPDTSGLKWSDDGTISVSGNADFFRRWFLNMGETQAATLQDSQGRPNSAAVQRLRAALVGRAYGDERVLSALSEDVNPDNRNIVNAMAQAAPAFATLDADSLANDVRQAIVGGLELVREANNQGQSVDDLLEQGDLLGRNPAAADLARFMAANARSARRMAEAFKAMAEYADRAQRQAANMDVFGGPPPANIGEAINAAGIERVDTRADARSDASRGQGGEQDQGERAAAGDAFQLDQQPAAEEARAAPQVSQQGLFAPPTGRELAADAQRRADAERNGLGRDEVPASRGDGELFAGPRPAQTDALKPDESGDVSYDDLSPAERDSFDRARNASEGRAASDRQKQAIAERSQLDGERKADELGLREPVAKVLEGTGIAVHFLDHADGLHGLATPDYIDLHQSQGEGKRVAGVYVPAHYSTDGEAFIAIYPRVASTPALAAFTAAHEVSGHHGLRALLGDDLNPALDIADQNPTVKAVADSMMKQRGLGANKRRLAVEEALADLAAAVRTGDFDRIQQKHGVEVPEGIRRERLREAIANFLRRLKALFAKRGVTFTDEQVRELLDAADAAAKDSTGVNEDVASSESALQSVVSDRDLVVTHNLSPEKLKHAIRMGGLAVPSLAVSKGDYSVTGYGSITLIGDSGLANPRAGAKAFGADIYSPRYPEITYRLDPAAVKSLNAVLGSPGAYWSREITVREMTSAEAFKEYMQRKRGDDWRYSDADSEAVNVLREAGAKELLFDGFTYSGNRRYSQHTLENVVKRLKKEIRGGENFNYGTGSLRARFTPQFRTLDAIRKAKGKLQTKEDFEAARKVVEDEIFEIADDLSPYYQHSTSSTFGFTDTVLNVIGDAARGGLDRQLSEYGFEGVPADTKRRIREYMAALRDMPTEYFEVKHLRPVGIDEFRAAVVPDTLDKASLGLLKEAGLRVSTYPANDDAARRAAVNDAASENDLLFNEEPAPRPDFLRTSTGESVIREGRLLTLIDAVKAAGGDLSALTEAVKNRDVAALTRAIDDLLPSLRPKPRVTGIKNAVTDAEREAAGRNPILAGMVKSNESAVMDAIAALKANPSLGAETIAKLSRVGVDGVSLADQAVLLVHKTELLNKREAAAKKIADPGASEDAKAVALQAWDAAGAEIAALDIAAKSSGTELGRALQFRKAMMAEDFTLAALEQKEHVRLGRTLTIKEHATIKAMADTIAQLQKRVDDLQARVANSESEWAYEHMVRRAPTRGGNRLASLRRAADEAHRRLRSNPGVPGRRGQSGAIISPTVFYDLSVIGAYHVANGAAKLADWVRAMRAQVGDWFDSLTNDHENIFSAAKRIQAEWKSDTFDVSPADVLAGIDKDNISPKDVRKLIAAHVGAGLRGEQAVIAAVAKDLGLAEDEVRALFVQSVPRGAQTLTEAQQELSDLRKLVRLQAELERLEAGRPKPEAGKPREDSPAVAAKKAELADLRKRLRPARDPEGRYQEMRGKQIARRIAELQARIEAGDFAKRPRVPRALNEANERAMYELDKAKEDFLRHQFEDNLKNRSPLGKIFGTISDALNLSRAIMTSFDLSAVFRQGGFIGLGHPAMAAKNIGPMLRAFASAKADHAIMSEIEHRPNARLYKKYGLQLTGIGTGPLTKIEEAYASRWLDSLPRAVGGGIIRGSGRAYTAFLNKLRADAFDAMAASLGKRATLTEAEGKAIANYINMATGRGKIGRNENAGEALNTVFFAPRLVASRFQLLVGQPLYGGTARTRKMILAEYARFAIGAGVVISLAGFGRDDDDDDKPFISFDPRSADFGKMRFGDTYVDVLGGLAQVTTLIGRLATGETVTGKGAVKPLRTDYTLTDLRRALGEDVPEHKLAKDGSLPFGSSSAADVIGRFLRTKLAPVPGFIVNALSGSNAIGQPMTPGSAAQELVTPMSFQNVVDVMEEQGIPRGTAITIAGLLGMGVQYRQESNADQLADLNANVDAVKSDVKDRLSKLPADQWPAALDALKKQYGPAMEGVELDTYKDDYTDKAGTFHAGGSPKMDKSGKPRLKSERLADEATYRKNAQAADGEQVHHIIADNLVRHHPLMARARELGYDLDNPDNLIGMPATAGRGAIAHNTDHPEYDAEVLGALNDAQRRLKREYGPLRDIPRGKLLDAIRQVEDEMRGRIQRRDVPTKDGRLAMLNTVRPEAA